MKRKVKYPFSIIMIIILIAGMPFTLNYLCKNNQSSYNGQLSHTMPLAEATPTPTEYPSAEITPTPTPKPKKVFSTVSEEYFNDALFIGDSRTVGLSEYAPFENATYFASVGMSAHNLMSNTVSVESLGKISLEQLLNIRTFGKIYIMLGINEIGYRFDTILSQYSQVIDIIRQLQPDAIIYIEANLHVSKSKSDEDPIINNTSINNLNSALKAFCDDETIFYVDINEIFDDETGSLYSDYTTDGVHIMAKYYTQWADWLCTKAIQI